MQDLIKRLAADEAGSSAVEYAVVAGIIALGIVVSLTGIGESLTSLLNNSADGLKN
jgi:Flp pilus assembly pilin Flp